MQKSVIRGPPRKQKVAQEKEPVFLSQSRRVWEGGQDWFRFCLFDFRDSVSAPLPFSVSVTVTVTARLSPFLRGSHPLPHPQSFPRSCLSGARGYHLSPRCERRRGRTEPAALRREATRARR